MIAFIVDGQLEKLAIERLCERQAPIRTPNLNGKVAIMALAKRIDTLLRLYGDRYFPIVIVFDREQRAETSVDLESQMAACLTNLGNDISRLLIVCADRMIENWIIAGSKSFQGNDLTCCQCADADGSNGKSELKQSLQQHNVTYGETTIGVEMLCTISPSLAASKSGSFSRLLTQIKPYCVRWANS